MALFGEQGFGGVAEVREGAVEIAPNDVHAYYAVVMPSTIRHAPKVVNVEIREEATEQMLIALSVFESDAGLDCVLHNLFDSMECPGVFTEIF